MNCWLMNDVMINTAQVLDTGKIGQVASIVQQHGHFLLAARLLVVYDGVKDALMHRLYGLAVVTSPCLFNPVTTSLLSRATTI